MNRGVASEGILLSVILRSAQLLVSQHRAKLLMKIAVLLCVITAD